MHSIVVTDIATDVITWAIIASGGILATTVYAMWRKWRRPKPASVSVDPTPDTYAPRRRGPFNDDR